MKVLVGIVLALISIITYSQEVNPFIDYRMCGIVNRDDDGAISRRRDILAAYQRLYPCPSTGKTYGACPKWALDHTIPLACGGCDSVTNLSWMPRAAKSCNNGYCKDRYERKIFPSVEGSSGCSFKITK